jgi:hypothetical protein
VEPLPAGAAHPLAEARVVQQRADGVGEGHRVVRGRVQRRLAGRGPALPQLELDDRPPERHVLEDLVHRRHVVHPVDLVRAHAHVGGPQQADQLVVGDPAEEPHVPGEAHRLGPRAQPRGLRPAPGEGERHVPAAVGDDDAGRLEQVVDALLDAHHAHVAHQVPPAVPQCRVGPGTAERPVRPGPHDEHVRRRHPAALHRDVPVARVGGDRDDGPAEGQALQQVREPDDRAARRVALGDQQLRRHVVVVEHEPGPQQQHQWQRDEEEQVRRVAGLDDADAPGQRDPPREQRLGGERDGVLHQVPGEPGGLEPRPVAVDVDTVDDLVAHRVLRGAGADHRDVVAGVAQRAGLLPHAPVERHGQVLDQDQHPGRTGSHHTSPR